MRRIYAFLIILPSTFAIAGNCVIQGNQKIGDCSNVNISNNPKAISVKSAGSYPNIYSAVTIKSGGKAYLSGIADSVTVEQGGELILTGTAGNIDVYGHAEIAGTSGFINARQNSRVTISGISEGVSGPGKIQRLRGSIIGGVYTK
jgi:hypothetical protein